MVTVTNFSLIYAYRMESCIIWVLTLRVTQDTFDHLGGGWGYLTLDMMLKDSGWHPPHPFVHHHWLIWHGCLLLICSADKFKNPLWLVHKSNCNCICYYNNNLCVGQLLGDQVLRITRPIDKKQVLFYNSKELRYPVGEG